MSGYNEESIWTEKREITRNKKTGMGEGKLFFLFCPKTSKQKGLKRERTNKKCSQCNMPDS